MTNSNNKTLPEHSIAPGVFWKGIAFVCAYMIVGAAGEVYAAATFQKIDLYTTLLISFAIIAVVFNVMARGERTPLSYATMSSFGLLNFATVMAWLGLFVGLKFVEPAIVVSLMVAIGPITTLVINQIVRKSGVPYASDILLSLLVAAVGAYLVVIQLSGRAGVNLDEGVVLGLAAATVAGVGLAATAVLVKRLYDLDVDGRAILAHRFYFVLVMLLFFVDFEILFSTLSGQASQAAIIALMTVTIPILLIQAGIRRLEPITVELLLCVSPLVTFLIQIFDTRLTQSVYTLIGNGTIVGIAVWSVAIHHRRVKNGS